MVARPEAVALDGAGCRASVAAPRRSRQTLTTVNAIAVALLDVDGTHNAGLDRDRLSSMAVHRAAGMVLEQLGASIEQALTRLRATAYAEGVPIHKLANDVITGDKRIQEDRG